MGEASKQAGQLDRIRVVEASRRLIEQKHGGRGGERACDLDQPPIHVRQRGRKPVVRSKVADQGQQRTRELHGGLVPPRPSQQAKADIVQHAQIGERLRGLKSAGQSVACGFVGGLARNLAAADTYRPGIRRLKAAHKIEQRGLARAVGADHAGYAAGSRVQIEAGDSDNTTKGDANIFGHQAATRPRDVGQRKLDVRGAGLRWSR